MSQRWWIGMFVAALPLMSVPAGAQDAPRTIAQYDKEASVQYVAAWEKGDRYGHGVSFQGGYRVCTLWGWQCQAVAELSVTNFDYFDATFKQFTLGVRFGKLMWPKMRPYAQLHVGVQNDGFENSNNAVVAVPGLGVSYALTRRFDVQVQLDFPIASYDSGTYNQARLGVGLGLPLGSR